ncbi:hypothetical protein HAX54_000764, partial [Datura stramonium]|nr:hypothetical protein [Datura stramonium]
ELSLNPKEQGNTSQIGLYPVELRVGNMPRRSNSALRSVPWRSIKISTLLTSVGAFSLCHGADPLRQPA